MLVTAFWMVSSVGGVEWRAELVGHGGEEFILQAVRFAFACQRRFALGLHPATFLVFVTECLVR